MTNPKEDRLFMVYVSEYLFDFCEFPNLASLYLYVKNKGLTLLNELPDRGLRNGEAYVIIGRVASFKKVEVVTAYVLDEEN